MKASECYEKVGDYRSATDILYKNERFRECISVFKRYEAQRSSGHRRFLQPPRSTLNPEKVVKEAAEICIKKRDFESLKGFLTELPLEKQLEYLKRKRGCEDVALEVLVENGRAEDAARIYMNKGKYLKAASCTKDDKTKGICLLEHARQLYLDNSGQVELERGSIQVNTVVHYLKNSIPLLATDHANLADAYFLIGTITDDTKSIVEATKSYRKAFIAIGALICDQILLDKGEIDTAEIFETLSRTYQQGGNLVASMKNAVMLQRFFGIEKVTEKGDIHYRINDQKLLYRLQMLKTSDVEGSDLKTHFDNLDENTGNALITRSILQLTDEVATRLMEVYTAELNRSTICQGYLRGIKHDNCTLLHQIPNEELAQKKFNAYFCIMQLQAPVRQFAKMIQKNNILTEDVMRFKSLQSCRESGTEMIDTCNAFYTDLIEYTRYLKRTEFQGLQLARSLPQMSYVKDQILWCIGALWERADEEGRYGDVNLFLKVFHISSFVGLSFVQDQIDAMKEGLLGRYGGLRSAPGNEACVFERKQFGTDYHTFHTIFNDSKLWLHDEGALIESIHHLLRRAIPVTLGRSKNIPPPSLTNMVMLLEFNISLCIVSLSRTHKSRNAGIYMPSFYIEGLQFWSGIYDDCNRTKYAAIDSIKYVDLWDGHKLVINLIKVAINLILKKKFEKLDMFREAFGAGGILLQASERFLVLVLVLLTNYNLYSLNNDATIANEFVVQLKRFAEQSKHIPGRLPQALQLAANIKKPEDAYRVLKFILEDSGNEVVYCTWKSFLNMQFPQAGVQGPRAEPPKDRPKVLLRPATAGNPTDIQKSLASAGEPITQEPHATIHQQTNEQLKIIPEEKGKVILRPPCEEIPPANSQENSKDRPRRTIQNFKRFLTQKSTGYRQANAKTDHDEATPLDEKEPSVVGAMKGKKLLDHFNKPREKSAATLQDDVSVFGSDPLQAHQTSSFGWQGTTGMSDS